MDGRRGKERRLKWRLLGNIAFILAVSMVISSLTGYWYFERVVREQKISGERSRLMQVSGQLTFMAGDIRQFAKSILIDKELQQLLEEDVSGSAYLKQRRSDKVAARLIFYGSLRSYIKNMIIRMEDGTCYGSSYDSIDTAYINEKLAQEEIAGYLGQEDGAFSEPYGGNRRRENQRMCFQMQMYDKYRFGQRRGTLYIEFELGYFLEPIRTYAGAENYICLLGAHGNILYGQDPDGKLSVCLEELAGQKEELRRTDNGYLVCDAIEGTGFRLGTLITDRYLWERSSFVLWFFLCSFLFSVGLILVFISRRMEQMIWPITKLSAQMETVKYGCMQTIETVHTGDEIEALYNSFGHMLEQLKKGEEERILYERQKHKMEYDITMSQIHPHYLYNVLNTVVYLAAAGKGQDVVTIVHALIDTLHNTLEIGGEHVETTVEKEIMLTQSYLEIQNYRYPGMVTAKITCSEELKVCRMPRIVIQPLVENAILHGILPAERAGTVWVDVEKKEGVLYVVVQDDGIGIGEDCLQRFKNGEEISSGKGSRRHIGIRNVRDRIWYLYGEEYNMEIGRREKGGTRVALRLPFVEGIHEEKTYLSDDYNRHSAAKRMYGDR
ncbi:hypothetical protein D3Z47_07410 [Lachnospiraceae bacterium]|nr:hypothetical protein [Lachnospiraceae bacterium]